MTHKILTIDDHPDTLQIIVETLKWHGYEVISTQSPVQGLKLIEVERPDLVLVDMEMPEMKGTELCAEVRARPDVAHTPIIMFTALTEAEIKLAGFEAGADDYLTKPTQPTELVERISALLGEQPGEPVPAESAEVEGKAPDQPGFLSGAGKSGGSVISIMGSRGGSGTTTVAINLATALAAMEQPTTLVDLDQGHVAAYLGQKVAASLEQLAGTGEENWMQVVQQHVQSYRDHLDLVLKHPDPLGERPPLSVAEVGRLIDSLRRSGQHVVVDLGQRVSPTTRPVLDYSDQLLVCVRPEKVAMLMARHLLRQLQGILLPLTTLTTVVIDIGEGSKRPASTYEGFLGQPVHSILALNPVKLTQSVNKGDAYVHMFPESRAAQQFQRLALQLVAVT